MEGLRPGDPQRVGRYRLLQRLGAGGMGDVYLGESPTGREVAVKIIRAELADDAVFRERFRQEVLAARRVTGSFTAPVVDADPGAPQPWMITEFVSGPSLAEAVATGGPLSARSVLILAAGLAKGVSAVHAAGLVHRDLKPSNVLLASDGPRIIDFGISRPAGAAGWTQAGGVLGSPGFMSPEQALGEPVGPASDIFSLGSVLAFAATGVHPFGSGPLSALLYRVVQGQPAMAGIPPELRPLIERCLAREPAARPTTDDLLAELGDAAPTADWLDRRLPAGTPVAPIAATMPDEIWPDLGAPAAEWPAGAELCGASDGGMAAGLAGPALAAEGFAMAATGADPSPLLPWSALAQPASQPPGGRGRRPRAALAAVCVLGLVIAGTIGLALLSRHEPGQAAAAAADSGRRVASVPRLSPQPPAPAYQPLAAGTKAPPSTSVTTGLGSDPPSPSATPTPTPTASPSTSPVVLPPGAVVLDYFAAINHRHWIRAWALGGKNLYATLASLIASYAEVSEEVVTILSVRDDTVAARIRTVELTGTVVVHRQSFVVKDGVIVFRGAA